MTFMISTSVSAPSLAPFVVGIHFAQKGGVGFAYGRGNIFGSKAAFKNKFMDSRDEIGRHGVLLIVCTLKQ